MLIGCGTFYNDRSQIPRLWEHIPNDQNAIFGIGKGNNLDSATEKSIVDISKQMHSDVYAEILRESVIENLNGEVIAEEKLEQEVQFKTQTILENVKRLQHRTSNNGNVYAFSYVKIDNAVNVDEQRIIDEIQTSGQT